MLLVIQSYAYVSYNALYVILKCIMWMWGLYLQKFGVAIGPIVCETTAEIGNIYSI